MKQLVLAGGGHAHVQVLAAFAQQVLPGVEVTLVTPQPVQWYSGMVPGVIAGRYSAHEAQIDLAALARRAGARVVLDAVVGVRPDARQLRLASGGELAYDALSLDTGGELSRDVIDGAREHALFVRPLHAFMHLWPRLQSLAARQPGLQVVVIGGGAAGFELAVAMRHALVAQARVTLVAGNAGLLPRFPRGLRHRALAVLKSRGITVIADDAVEIEPGQLRLSGGSRLPCDAPVVALGVQPPAWLAHSGLRLAADGFIATTASLQSVSHPEVFAVGDVSCRIDAPHPRSGVYAVRAGPVLAANLRAWAAGRPYAMYRPQRRALALLSCADGTALASWGPLSARGAWVWRWKDRIDRAFVQAYRDSEPLVSLSLR
ncbi:MULTISPECIES: FAD-dependent oxidoreductase [Caldimonas]|uniref:FAD-dependent oxidoreductase n=1 Tax=Caldimonas TaxID=196013 RepID=UPI0003787CBA|nr:FAD-dependent oxidoreductase [Caldimonas manganoxidans]